MQGVFQSPRRRGTRRTGRPLLALASCLLLAGACATPRFAAVPQPLSLAPGVYAFTGTPGAADPANRGRIGNQGVIVGTDGLVVVGTGTSHADGEALLEAAGSLSAKPVVLAINLHAAPEHVLGNSAFAARGIPILAHRETDRYMAHNCETCLRNLRATVGSAAVAGSRPERPTRLLDTGTTLDVAGRSIEVLHFGTTQQAGALAVFDRRSGVLFAGGLASFDVIPDTRDADIEGWLAALRELRRRPIAGVLPGRGPPGDAARLDEVAEYLEGLARETERAYRGGATLSEAVRRVRLPRFEAWALYRSLHPRNVHHEYLKLEARDLAR